MADFKFVLLSRVKRFLPVFSFLWALFSGYRIGRDFSRGWLLLVLACGVWVVLYALSRWVDYVEKLQGSSDKIGGVRGYLLRDGSRVEWLGATLAQVQAQYVLLFSVPFLYWSGAWLLLGATLTLVLTTLWDPWWQYLVRFSWYERIVRSFSFVLAASFAIAIVLPGVAVWVEAVCLALGLALVVPFHFWRGLRAVDLIAPLVWLTMVALHSYGVRTIPLLSVWVAPEASFGFDVNNRELGERFPSKVATAVLHEGILQGRKVCCWTPIVAPRSLHSALSHVWTRNGSQVIDVIPLGDVVGLDKDRAFRTYSCKTALEGLSDARSIQCRVRIGGSVDIGGTSIKISKD